MENNKITNCNQHVACSTANNLSNKIFRKSAQNQGKNKQEIHTKNK